MKILITTNTFGEYNRQTVGIQSLKKLKEEFPDIVDELIDLTNTIPETKHSENLNTNTHDALDSLFHK